MHVLPETPEAARRHAGADGPAQAGGVAHQQPTQDFDAVIVQAPGQWGVTGPVRATRAPWARRRMRGSLRSITVEDATTAAAQPGNRVSRAAVGYSSGRGSGSITMRLGSISAMPGKAPTTTTRSLSPPMAWAPVPIRPSRS
jgi:hypothetical protein